MKTPGNNFDAREHIKTVQSLLNNRTQTVYSHSLNRNVPVIPSEIKRMLNREYTLHCIGQAAAYGESVSFWIRDNSPKEAAKQARLAARWALKVIGRGPEGAN